MANKPLKVFGFNHPLQKELERILSLQGDMNNVVRCLQMLVPPSSLMREGGMIGMALFTQALISYVRCFTSAVRKGLRDDLFASDLKLKATHTQVKLLRDQHVAHAVGKEVGNTEECSVLVVAADQDSKAQGLGVRYWFYAGGDPAQLKQFLRLSTFVAAHLKREERRLGDELAKTVIGPRATWKSAQRAFARAASFNSVYGPSDPDRPEPPL